MKEGYNNFKFLCEKPDGVLIKVTLKELEEVLLEKKQEDDLE